MGFLKPKTPRAPDPAPPTPTVDTAVQERLMNDRTLRSRRGAATALLTSPSGLPNLGTTSTATAGGGMP